MVRKRKQHTNGIDCIYTYSDVKAKVLKTSACRYKCYENTPCSLSLSHFLNEKASKPPEKNFYSHLFGFSFIDYIQFARFYIFEKNSINNLILYFERWVFFRVLFFLVVYALVFDLQSFLCRSCSYFARNRER